MIGDTLRRLGIELRSIRDGNQKAKCPKCSDRRKNKADPCLSVKVAGDTIKWNCFNCGWKGSDHGNQPTQSAYPRNKGPGARNSGALWRRRLTEAWY